jgi:hypothetical protein
VVYTTNRRVAPKCCHRIAMLFQGSIQLSRLHPLMGLRARGDD